MMVRNSDFVLDDEDDDGQNFFFFLFIMNQCLESEEHLLTRSLNNKIHMCIYLYCIFNYEELVFSRYTRIIK